MKSARPKAFDQFDPISLLADVATKLLTHPDERAVDVAGSLSHPSRSRQCNKRDNQQVLDHTLATLVTVKSIQQGKLSPQLVLLPVKNQTVS